MRTAHATATPSPTTTPTTAPAARPPVPGTEAAALTASPAGSRVGRHPLGVAVGGGVAVTWGVQFGFLAAGWPLMGALLVELGVLVGLAVLVTRAAGGPGAVRRLFAGVVRWRFGAGRWLLLVTAMPLVTVAVAAAIGTLQAPPDGYASAALGYLALTLVVGTVLGNVWEELFWAGVVQRRLADRHGGTAGALLTAVPFALIHLPMAFEADGLTGTSARDLAITWTVLVAAAPFLRLLVGVVVADTGGSILAAGVLHGAFNASGALALLTGGWEHVPAMAVLAVAAVGYARVSRGRGRAAGRP